MARNLVAKAIAQQLLEQRVKVRALQEQLEMEQRKLSDLDAAYTRAVQDSTNWK